jgi:hypothetical protein
MKPKLSVVVLFLAVFANVYASCQTIDLVNQRELRRANLAPLGRPHGIVFVDGQVYFTAEMNKVIGRYSPSDDRVSGCWARDRMLRICSC